MYFYVTRETQIKFINIILDKGEIQGDINMSWKQKILA